MKKGPLSKKDKELIKELYLTHSCKELSAKLERSESTVEKYVMTLDFKPDEPKSEVKQENVVQDISNQFAKNKERGVVVMTEAASMASDESKKNKQPSKMPSRYSNYIHKIK